jgi:hypothetical protein
MAAAFRRENLPQPPMPTALRPALGEIGSGCWSTRQISAMDMYLFEDPAREVLTGPVADYVAVSQARHGTDSYAINYHLVYRSLALFAQVGWGGTSQDEEFTTAPVATLFASCQALIDAAEDSDSSATGPWKLVCVDSDLRGISAAGWVVPPGVGTPGCRHLAGHPAGMERATRNPTSSIWNVG